MQKINKLVKSHKEICEILLAILFSNLLFFHQKNWLMNPVYMALTAILFYVVIKNAINGRQALGQRRIGIGCAVFGVLFSMMAVVGSKIEAGNLEFAGFHLIDVAWFGFYTILGMVLFYNVYLLGENKKVQQFIRPMEEQNSYKKNWIFYSIILIAAWIPVFVSYYPGIVTEDATCSIAFVIGELPWNNQFPVFYSLIIGAFLFVGYSLNNVNIGIALYSIFQLLIMAGGIGFFLSWLQRKGFRKTYIYFGLAYFTAAPMFGNYAIVMWKDPWFSGLLILISIFLYENVSEKRDGFLEKKKLVQYATLLVLMCLMRNNGIYIACLLNVCLVIVYRTHLKKILLPLVGSILFVYIVTGPVYATVFQAENLFVESLGVPLQQMSRTVVKGGEMSEQDVEFMNNLMPLEQYAEYYNPFLVDPVKWAPKFNTQYLDAHKKEFFQTWWSMLTKNLGIYVEQYLMGTYGYWHIGGDTNYELAKTGVADNTWGLESSNLIERYTGYPMRETLNSKYDYIASGLLIWLMFGNIVLCWMRKKSIYILPLLVMTGTWLTLMLATPTAFGVRYIYVFVIGLPLLLSYQWLIVKQKGHIEHDK